MSDGEEVRGIVLGHGLMARGLVDAVTKISGVEDGILVPLSNEGKSPQTLQEELDLLIGEGPTVLFTDLPSGSCALAARVCCKEVTRQVVISGVNLPILLDFVFNRHLSLNELVPRLLSKGIGSVKSVPEFSEHANRPL
jgi:mannose/fructose-specific phosphotransferase system component IIA